MGWTFGLQSAFEYALGQLLQQYAGKKTTKDSEDHILDSGTKDIANTGTWTLLKAEYLSPGVLGNKLFYPIGSYKSLRSAAYFRLGSHRYLIP